MRKPYQNIDPGSAKARAAADRRRNQNRFAIVAFAAAALALLYSSLSKVTYGSPGDVLKHLAAYPNCYMALEFGVAPARRGEPGYWERHDINQDGIACDKRSGEMRRPLSHRYYVSPY